MRALRAGDLLELAELCGSSEVSAFESGVLEVLRRHVGFDFALFRRKRGYGSVSIGFAPALLQAVAPFWPVFVAEGLSVPNLSRLGRGVVADSELYSPRQLERRAVYRMLAQPAGEALGVNLLSWHRGRCVANLRLGRSQRGFKAAELERLRAFMPQIRLSETLRYFESKLPTGATVLEGLGTGGSPGGAGDVARALSARERDVVAYLGLGYTNEQIATACGSSPLTVRNQLSRAYAKLGVASRAEAVSVLARRAR